MKPVVEFLRSRGVSDADVVKLIVGHPPLLSYNVPARLQPFWEYLAAVGCKDVAGVIAKRPSLLGLDVNDNLKKIVEYLQSTGTAPELIVEYIEKSI